MAVNFSAIQGPTYALPHHNPYYAAANATSQQHSPDSSNAGTPVNGSPTSQRRSSTTFPHLAGFQSRQLRPPKAPLYVPAVLRPTERPARSSPPKDSRLAAGPLTPPSSAGNSYDGKDGPVRLDCDGVQRRVRSEIPAAQGITRIVTDEWNDDVLEAVTGIPTRDHWQPDSSTSHCNDLTCRTPFTLITRRHHCRRCGNIFCSPHSAHSVPLDQHARFHPQGHRGRVCVCCWSDFTAWKRVRQHKRQESLNSPVDVGGGVEKSGSKSEPGTPITSHSVDGRNIPTSPAQTSGHGPGAGETVAGSVKGDWNWSTF